MPDSIPSSPATPTAPAQTPKAPSQPVHSQSTGKPQVGKPAQTLGEDVKPPTAPEIRKYKVKVDGQESEVDEHELIRNYQIRKAADKRLEEGTLTKKQYNEALENLRNPKTLVQALKDLGYDPRQLSEAYLSNELEYELMTPEQKRLYQAELKLQSYKEEEERRKKEEEEKSHQTVTERQANELQKSIIGILESERLPKKPSTVWRIARQMLINLDNGIDVEPKDVVYDVAREIKQEHQDLYGDLDGEQLLQLLGEDVAGKLRKHDLSRVTNKIPQTRDTRQQFTQRKPEKKFTTEREFDEYLRKIKQNGK